MQYPSFSRARVRHVELVSLGETRVMTVLITDSGQVEQRLIDLPTPVDEVFLSELRASVNAVVGAPRSATPPDRSATCRSASVPTSRPS